MDKLKFLILYLEKIQYGINIENGGSCKLESTPNIPKDNLEDNSILYTNSAIVFRDCR